MKKEFMVKRILSVFLIVLGLGVTSFAQKPSPFVTIAEKPVVSQNIHQEIASLKSSLQSLAPGSADHVDAIRRIEVYGKVSVAISSNSDTSIAEAIEEGRVHLYQVLESKESEIPKLNLIYQDLMTLVTN